MHNGLFLLHGAVQSSREEPSSPTRAPGVRQLADTFHLDARVHKKQETAIRQPLVFSFMVSSIPPIRQLETALNDVLSCDARLFAYGKTGYMFFLYNGRKLRLHPHQ